MSNKKKIIILTYYRFPCVEPVLENVFAKELGREYEVTWLFQGDVSKGRKQKWHNSQVLLSREIKGNHWYSKLANNILKWHKFLVSTRAKSKGNRKSVSVTRSGPSISFSGPRS